MAIYAQPVQIAPKTGGSLVTIVLFVSAASIDAVPAEAGALLQLFYPDFVAKVWETAVTVTTS